MENKPNDYIEFDPEIFEAAKKEENQESEPLYTTSVLPDLGIDAESIPVPDYEEIRKNKTAFLLFVHKVKEQGETYQRAMRTATEAKRKVAELERTANDRKSAVIIMTVAEIITAIGTGGLFTEYAAISWIVLAAGILLTVLSLYLNFKK